MTSKEAAQLYQRIGRPVPAQLAAPAFEKVSNTRRKAVDGIVFRSTLEADVYQLLSLWERAGRIGKLVCQPKFLLQAKMRRDGKAIREICYIADFSFERDGRLVVVDAKGWRMDVYRIKRKLLLALYPDLTFEEWTRQTLREMS